MSISMQIYHGRDNPNQEMNDWGTQGPTLININTVKYQNGSVSLHYSSEEKHIEAFNLTSWLPVIPGAMEQNDLYLSVPFYYSWGTREFVLCINSDSKKVIYYSDFVVRHENPGHKFKMRLYMNEKHAGYFPKAIREIVLEDVSALHFVYGAYSLWFDCAQTCQKARALTGWETGIDPQISLEIPLSPFWDSVITYISVPQGKDRNLYDHFELLPQ